MGLELHYEGLKLSSGSSGLPVKPISLTEWNAMTEDQRNREILWLVDQNESRSWDVRESSSRYILYYHNEMVGGDEVQIIGSVNESNPIGTVISFMGTSSPNGYLVCDGTEYPISQYTKLADFFQEQFGSSSYFGGDGISTFAVPDLRNNFIRGYHGDANPLSGNIGQRQRATEQLMFGVDSRAGQQLVTYSKTDSHVHQRYTDSTSDEKANNWVHTNGTSYGVAVSNESLYYTARPVNVAVLFCIKATDSEGGVTNDPVNRYFNGVYSEEEVRIGTWFGKPLYQKGFIIEMGINHGINTIGDVSELNIDKLVDVFGSYLQSYNNSGILERSIDGTLIFGLSPDAATFYIWSDNPITVTIHSFVIKYTKTTDEPEDDDYDSGNSTDLSNYVTKTEFNETVGDISTVLDAILGGGDAS